MPLFLAVSVPGFTALLSLGGVRPGKQTLRCTWSKLREVPSADPSFQDSCLSSLSSVHRQLAFHRLSRDLGFCTPGHIFRLRLARQPHPFCRGACAGRRKVRSQDKLLPLKSLKPTGKHRESERTGAATSVGTSVEVGKGDKWI